MSNPVASDVCPYLRLTLGCLIVVFFSVASLPYSIKPPEALVIYE